MIFYFLLLVGVAGLTLPFWATYASATERSQRTFGIGAVVCIAVMIIGLAGSLYFYDADHPDLPGPDLHDPVLTQNGTMTCTYLNASEPASGYVCLPATGRPIRP